MIKNIIIFAILLLMSNSILSAQGTTPNCTPAAPYVQQHDGTGRKPLSTTQLTETATKLAQAFPEPYCSAFKVYDYGLTPISQYTKGGYAEDFGLMKLQCMGADRMQPYLLFAREVNTSGIVSKIWVDVQLPTVGNFSCLTATQRSLVRIRVEKEVADAMEKTGGDVIFSEMAGMDKLRDQVVGLLKCCGRKKQRDFLCGCTDKDVKEIVDAYKFEGFEIDAVAAQAASINTNTIHDASNIKIDVAGSSDYIGKHLEEFATSLNQKVGLNIEVVSNLNICFRGIDDCYSFAKEKEFGAVIIGNPQSADPIDKKNLKVDVFWNEDKKQVFQNKEDAEVFLIKLKGYLLQALDVYPNGIIVENNSANLQGRLINLLNQYMGTTNPIFKSITNPKGETYIKARVLVPNEITDKVKLKFYEKIKEYTLVSQIIGGITKTYVNVNFTLVDENTSGLSGPQKSKPIDGKEIVIDYFAGNVLDVGDLELVGDDFGRCFFHAIYEQYIYLTKPIEWTTYITDCRTGKIETSLSSLEDRVKGPYYDIAHAYTCEKELEVFGYTYAPIGSYDKKDLKSETVYIITSPEGNSIDMAVDKAKVEIVQNPDCPNDPTAKTYRLNISGHKILHKRYMDFKSKNNQTFTRYERKQ